MDVTESQVGGCCGPTSSEKADPCCEQPSDGSSCCEKSETREMNAAKTGCC